MLPKTNPAPRLLCAAASQGALGWLRTSLSSCTASVKGRRCQDRNLVLWSKLMQTKWCIELWKIHWRGGASGLVDGVFQGMCSRLVSLMQRYLLMIELCELEAFKDELPNIVPAADTGWVWGCKRWNCPEHKENSKQSVLRPDHPGFWKQICTVQVWQKMF